MRIVGLFFSSIVFLSNSATAQQAPPNAAPVNCASAEHRQFDFWLGDWTVMGGPKGDQLQGSNRIERSKDGCRIVEHWTSANGNDGMSLNAWDAQYKVWRQFWVGGDGVVLRLEGGMQGELPNANGGVQKQKISWVPKDDGSVIQRWDVSDDEGKTWSIGFLGIYMKPKK
jgi:hypothetical protein